MQLRYDVLGLSRRLVQLKTSSKSYLFDTKLSGIVQLGVRKDDMNRVKGSNRVWTDVKHLI